MAGQTQLEKIIAGCTLRCVADTMIVSQITTDFLLHKPRTYVDIQRTQAG